MRNKSCSTIRGARRSVGFLALSVLFVASLLVLVSRFERSARAEAPSSTDSQSILAPRTDTGAKAAEPSRPEPSSAPRWRRRGLFAARTMQTAPSKVAPPEVVPPGEPLPEPVAKFPRPESRVEGGPGGVEVGGGAGLLIRGDQGAGVQFGGGEGFRVDGAHGTRVQFGGGQGFRINGRWGGGVQFGGGRGVIVGNVGTE